MKKALSFNQAAALYLTAMLLALTLGTLFQLQAFAWGLIATEVVCILLPALLWLRHARVPIKSGLRLNWPGWPLLLLSLLLGVAMWFVGATLDGLLAWLFGYSPAVGPDAFPSSAGSAIMHFLALAISVPIAEEVFFRGALQGAYRQSSRAFGILFTAGLFMVFHFRLQGLMALLPVALLLGIVVERSNSLFTGIALHAGNNAIAALVGIWASLRPDTFNGIFLAAGLLPAILIAGLLLALFLRRTRQAGDLVPREPAASGLGFRFGPKAVWPLAIALLLYVLVASLELLLGRFPAVMAAEQVEYVPLEFIAPIETEYRISNPIGEPVGEARCTMTREDNEIALNCVGEVAAFDVTQGASQWSDNGHTETLLVRWHADTMQLLEYNLELLGDFGAQTYSAFPEGEGYRMLMDFPSAEDEQRLLPAGALVHNEWAWRAMALPFSVGYAADTILGMPYVWQEELGMSAPLAVPTLLQVVGGAPLATPAGNFLTWQVRLDRQVAYYEEAAPHRLVRWENDYTVWELK